MDGATSGGSSSCSRGGREMALQQLQLLPWLEGGVKAVAADGGHDDDLAGSSAAGAAKTGKRRSAAHAGIARGMKVFLSGVVEMIGKRFECSVPAAKFGHVAYIR
ncbi:hypothetical protein SETIT_2G387100v2 [Setaria italica]|uniref:Uncharacterized protein n=1 Tax=Setaria italica TaxID=4555 RepID=K3ZYB4_SETIT|nr:hypothetical protein SETIT_2G387100v2 [Setaria italica]RCV13945.1 hypothetical protein SETIT_2G387100v2 [Setaria italica]RCV13946.1 hypothetical protein SETIT_2G387100v2 [Setaria italica]